MIYALGNQLIQIQTNESIIISDDFINIGYNSNELTYTYDISDITYPDVFWIIVGENYEYVGESSSQEELLTNLNNTGLGVFTVQDDILSVTGYAVYGELFGTVSEEIIPDSALLIDTSDPQSMLNIYGSTAFDISIEHSIVGNTALINNIKALNFKFLAYPSGAVINWLHYVDPPGDQWNAIEQDAIDRGKDWQTAQGGDLYNGGVRLPFILLVLLLSMMVINYMDHSDTKKTNDPAEKSYIPEKGFIGNLWEALFGKKEPKEKKSEHSTNNNPQLNPNVQYKWDKKLEIEIEENRHREEMERLKQNSNAGNGTSNGSYRKPDMTPLNTINTPTHENTGWGGDGQKTGPGSAPQMQQLDGFKLPQ
jgi:hypothetical protein